MITNKMLLAISEFESYRKHSVKLILEKVLQSHDGSDIYVLVVPSSNASDITISLFLDQLETVYDVSFNLKKEHDLKLDVTVVSYDEDYNSRVASTTWKRVCYTENVTLDQIPKAYRQHIHNSEKISVEVDDKETESHSKYCLHDPNAMKKSIPVVAVGGTFDHLHDGHKVLLSVSTFLTQKTLIVGVTGPELLRNKKYAAYMESLQTRSEKVASFVNVFSGGFVPEIHEINDVCGPTASIETIDALVVSMETVKGAEYINNVRTKKGWKNLDVYTVGVLGGSGSETFDDKLSSTDYRRREFLKHQPHST